MVRDAESVMSKFQTDRNFVIDAKKKIMNHTWIAYFGRL